MNQAGKGEGAEFTRWASPTAWSLGGHRAKASMPPSMSKAAKPLMLMKENGAARGIRTPDPLITNEVLYQLS